MSEPKRGKVGCKADFRRYDNAVIEAFHVTIKRELIYQKKFANQEIVKQEIYSYLEFFYNRKRKHSSLKNSI